MSSPLTPRQGLAEARRRAGFTQAACAVELGVTKHTVAQWERGATGIHASRRPAIAALYGISLAELDRLINGEPLNLPAAASVPAYAAPGDPGTGTWLIDAARLPCRPYRPVPEPATDLLLSVDPRESALGRARRILDQITPIIRITAGTRA
jgi:transcriptional regulator with XRE-family HTH domain